VTTAHDRRIAQAAEAAQARVHELAEGWEHAAPRLPRNGHRADCPDRTKGHIRRCRHCIADVIGAEPHQHPLPLRGVAPTQPAEPLVRACPRCYGPTTTPEEHCR
jgi:hypothetical protein